MKYVIDFFASRCPPASNVGYSLAWTACANSGTQPPTPAGPPSSLASAPYSSSWFNWRNYHQDVIPLAFAPVSMWRHGAVDVDASALLRGDPRYRTLGWTESNGHLYPRKSIFVSILVAPFYLLPVLAGVPDSAYFFWIAWGRLAAAVSPASRLRCVISPCAAGATSPRRPP